MLDQLMHFLWVVQMLPNKVRPGMTKDSLIFSVHALLHLNIFLILIMNDIKKAIKLLSKHNYRSTSNVVGEYVEKLIASASNGEQAKHCQKGFDVFSKSLGKIEVKSRNIMAKSKKCTIPARKLEILDNFILVIMKDGEIDEALLFSKKALLSIRSDSGYVYVDLNNRSIAKDITSLILNRSL